MGGIVMWIARDRCGTLYLYSEKPIRYGNFWIVDNSNQLSKLPVRWFPEVKWEDEPIELILKR